MPDEVRMIDLGLIDLPAYVRQHSDESVEEMAQDLKDSGQLQDAVVVSKGDGRYELIAGNRRRLGALKLGWKQLRCLVKESLTGYQRARLMFKENDDRDDLNAIDRWQSYKIMMALGKFDQAGLAADIGKTKAHISQYMAIDELPEQVRSELNRFNFGIAHINQIARLPAQDGQIAMIERCAKEDLSVKQLENLVSKALSSPLELVRQSPNGGGEGQGEGNISKSKTQPKGITCVKAGKGFHFGGSFKDLIPMDDFLKAAGDAYQLLLDEQAKSKTHPGRLDPEALKAAKTALKADKASIASLEKEIEGLETAAKGLEKIKRDSAGIRHEIEQKQAEIKALRAKIKEANKANSGLRKGPVKKARPLTPSTMEPVPSTEPSVGRRQSPSGGGEGQLASSAGMGEGGGGAADSHTFVLPLPPELTSKCEAEIARIEKEYIEAQAPEEKAAKKAELQKARAGYNEIRKEFGVPPIDYPEIQ